jgi:hypothetical protein
MSQHRSLVEACLLTFAKCPAQAATRYSTLRQRKAPGQVYVYKMFCPTAGGADGVDDADNCDEFHKIIPLHSPLILRFILKMYDGDVQFV